MSNVTITRTDRFSVIDNGDGTFSIRDRFEDEPAPGGERARYTDGDVAQIVVNRSNAFKANGEAWQAMDLGSIARYGIITNGQGFCAWDWLTNELPTQARVRHSADAALRDITIENLRQLAASLPDAGLIRNLRATIDTITEMANDPVEPTLRLGRTVLVDELTSRYPQLEAALDAWAEDLDSTETHDEVLLRLAGQLEAWLLADAELAAGTTALSKRITAPDSRRRVVAAVSANGRWGYERETTKRWAIYDKSANRFFGFGVNLDHARQLTFDEDHPLHTVAPAPRPMRFSVI